MLTENQIQQGARVLFQRMLKARCRLVRAPGDATGWHISQVKSRRRKSASRHDVYCDELIARIQQRGWLVPDARDRLVMSSEARDWMAKVCPAVAAPAAPAAQAGPATAKAIPEIKAIAGSNDAESPLTWLHARKDKSGTRLISNSQFEAGERLRRDFTIAGLAPRVTASWDPAGAAAGRKSSRGISQGLTLNEASLAAKQRFFAALDAVGPDLSGILMQVCCLWNGLEAAERALDWPRRSGKIVLQIALSRLAIHYGLEKSVATEHRWPAIRHWAMPGYTK